MMKNSQKNKFLVILILFYFWGGCQPNKKWDCIKSTGRIVTEFKNLTPFKKLEVHDKIEIEIFLQNQYSLEIQAGKNLIPKIFFEVKDSCLVIKNLNRCNFMRDPSQKIRIKIYMPTLLSIHQYGYGNIYLKDTLFTDSVAVFNEGNGDIHLLTNSKVVYGASYASGDLYLCGSTHHLYYHLNGGNFLRAFNMFVKEYIYVSNYSIGDVYVYTNGWLDGELRSKGNLYYKGNPQILIKKITKGGKVIKID